MNILINHLSCEILSIKNNKYICEDIDYYIVQHKINNVNKNKFQKLQNI